MISTGPIATQRLGELPAGLAALTTAEADARRRRYGTNEIVPDARHGWLELARDTARDPMLWFLIGVAALYVAIGQASEALPLLVAIVPLVGMDAFLHRRTHVLAGSATVRLVYTGGETLYGEIARSASSGSQARTPVQAAITALVSVLGRRGVALVRGPCGRAPRAGARRRGRDRECLDARDRGDAGRACSRSSSAWACTGTITERRRALTHLHPAPGLTDAHLLALADCTSAASSTDALDTAIRGAALEHGVVSDALQ